MARLAAVLILCTSVVAFGQDSRIALRPVRMTAGEARSAPVAPLGARLDSIVSAKTEPPLRFPIAVNVDAASEGTRLHLTVPPATPAGGYRIDITGRTQEGSVIAMSLPLVIDRVTIPKSASGRVPVILMNGFQLSCEGDSGSSLADSQGTFGQLASLLQSDGAPVSFFNNCAYGSDVSIEQLAGELGAYIASITYTDGTPVTQVDLVAHSMGGLIARAYLAGMQSGGSFVPVLEPKIRKLVLLATPNFGSFAAALAGGTQTTEMTLGSAFLWNLATWNQRQDDLRGVDALAVIGNEGNHYAQGLDDGIVSITSGSLGFARSDQRTRIVPYCHVTSSFLISLVVNCTGQGIADVDGPSHLTAQIVRSFLADTQDWTSIGKAPSQDSDLSQLGGLYVSGNTASGQAIADFTQFLFGSTNLNNGGAAGTVFYNEFLRGTNAVQGTSASLGPVSCGAFTQPTGYYATLRCKIATTISSVGPVLTGSAARIVQSGATITIGGLGFGQQCGTCAVTLSPGGMQLQISSWTDQTITAFLPAYSGVAQITVKAAGSDTIRFMTAPPASSVLVSSVTNGASFAPGAIAPGEIVTIKGSGIGPANGVSFSVNPGTGMVDTTLADTQVSFGGLFAPILYASAAQINAIVPYEVAGQAQVVMQVSYQGHISAGTTLQVASAAPAAFTFNSTGSGEALAANQDGSYNSAANPAAKGSYVTLYFTGGGETNPAGMTGSVTGLVLKRITQDISVTVGGTTETVTFAGAAPTFVDGVLQLNLHLADDTPSGSAEPLVITVGGASSPPLATLAIQ